MATKEIACTNTNIKCVKPLTCMEWTLLSEGVRLRMRLRLVMGYSIIPKAEWSLVLFRNGYMPRIPWGDHIVTLQTVPSRVQLLVWTTIYLFTVYYTNLDKWIDPRSHFAAWGYKLLFIRICDKNIKLRIILDVNTYQILNMRTGKSGRFLTLLRVNERIFFWLESDIITY